MATATTASTTLSSSTEPTTTTTPIQTDVDNNCPPPESAEMAHATEESLIQPTPQSPSHTARESNISEIDPNAFKITILLASSGYRTQISINRSFLEKSSIVEADGFLVSQLKNAIWKDWPSDWPDALPPSPNFLRLIYGGKMLADKSTLTECNVGPGKPNILHLSIRPADFVDDEYESGKKLAGIRRRGNGDGCCNCIVS